MESESLWRARLRWRWRGALQWPVFCLLTVLDALLLGQLPIAGDGGTGFVPALLVGFFFNLVAVAVVAPLVAHRLRRRRPDLPKVVADDYAGLAALGAVGLAFLVAGLVHRPELNAEHEAFARQSMAVRLWVEANGDDFTRAHVDAADTVQVDRDLYRTCVPGPDPERRRWLCLIVDTSHQPPRVRRDTSRESNASQNPRGVFR